MTAVKCLFSGALEGDLPGVFKKVEAVNKKNGPFAALFCVGQFFAWGDDAADPTAEVVDCVTSDSPVSVPTYFIGAFGAGSRLLLEALPASKSGMKYLGRAGVTTITGLTVAFLDGTYSSAVYNSTEQPPPCGHYTRADVDLLKAQLQSLDGDVDVLLTCEWPRGIAMGLPEGLLPEGCKPSPTSGSAVVAEIAQLARPRYHFAGGEPYHLARPPYVNPDLGVGPRATRFIALAPAANTTKQKALHALSLVPANDMPDPEALAALPEGATSSPYEGAAAGGGSGQKGRKRDAEEDPAAGGQDWRWNMNGPGGKKQKGAVPQPIQAKPDVPRDPWKTIVVRNIPWAATEADISHFFAQAGQVVNMWRDRGRDGKVQAWTHVQFDDVDAAQRSMQLHGTELLGRQVQIEPATASSHSRPASGKPVDGCWFCLGSANADTNLVASVGEEVYLALDKGAITPEHVLLVPIDHYPSTLSLSPQCQAEMERYMSALRTFHASAGRELIAFERHLMLRNKGGNHTHVNTIGVPRAAAARAKQAFMSAASRAGFEMQHLPTQGQPAEEARRAVAQAVGDSEYLMVVLPDGSRLVRPLMRGERLPMNLGREVLAELAGVPERADWKACTVEEKEEIARTDAFKEAFKPYDIMP